MASKMKPEQSPLRELELTTEVLTGGDDFHVVLFNDDVHTFDEVISQLIKAIRCDAEKARRIAHTVHTTGKAIVFDGSIEACVQVSAILEEIELRTEIQTSINH